MNLRLVITNRPTENRIDRWHGELLEDVTSELGAKQYASNTARGCIYENTGESVETLKGKWETKEFGWVRWHDTVCISLFKEDTPDEFPY